VASKSLERWLKMSWESKRVSAQGVALNSRLSPRGWGLASPFIDQGGGKLHARRAIQLRGGARRATL
jgi:hypothetical protein